MIYPIKILFIIIGYLAGSIMFGPLLYRLFCGKPIQDNNLPGGSGSMKRMGFLRGALVGIMDVVKVFLPVYIAQLLDFDFLTISRIATAGVIGHM